jgi:hypothetical protein
MKQMTKQYLPTKEAVKNTSKFIRILLVTYDVSNNSHDLFLARLISKSTVADIRSMTIALPVF